mgnify:CR=1 FL=1
MLSSVRNLKRSSKLVLLIIILAILGLGGAVIGLRSWYNKNLTPVSQSAQTQYFTVSPGSGLHQIGVKLKSAGLIRSTRAFETYVRSNELHDKLQAGTYSLSPSMNVSQIVKKMVEGDVAKNLLTILPQKRLDEIKEAFAAAGYSKAEIEVAFNPGTHRSHLVLASLPPGASLEGYLYPDSFQKQADTPASTIVRESLDEMQKYLTADIINGFGAHSLNVFQAITLASIVAEETDDPQYQPTVAQVFYTRLVQGMRLESDPTAFYASAITGQQRSLSIDSPYNTYQNGGLPPGPISNMTYDALRAVANPSSTDYLFFVAGDDYKVHFSRTQAEHEDAVKKYCSELCAQ